MKTAISIDEDLLRRADRVARHLGMSRSGLFSSVIQDYLRQREAAEISRKLNRVYDPETVAEQKKMARRIKTKVRPTIKDLW